MYHVAFFSTFFFLSSPIFENTQWKQNWLVVADQHDQSENTVPNVQTDIQSILSKS